MFFAPLKMSHLWFPSFPKGEKRRVGYLDATFSRPSAEYMSFRFSRSFFTYGILSVVALSTGCSSIPEGKVQTKPKETTQKKEVSEVTKDKHKLESIIKEELGKDRENKAKKLASHLIQTCKIHSVDPYLVVAVIKVESAFKTRSVSHKGARGLMQVMPATALEVAQQRGIPYSGPHDLYDPKINTAIGVAYLSWLKDRYNGQPALFLAAYNAGPGFVDRTIRYKKRTPGQITSYVSSVLGKLKTIKELSVLGPAI